MSTPEIVARVAIYAAAVPAIALPVLYFWRSEWRATLAGRALMTLMTAIGLIFAATVVYGLWPNLPGLQVVAAFLYAGLAVALWRLLWRLWQVQQRERHGP